MRMNPCSALGLIWLGAAAMMAVVWVYCHRKRDATLVDIAWAFGIGFAAMGSAAVVEGNAYRRWGVALLAGGWSVRLGLHMLKRAIAKKEEDDEV